MEALLEDWFNRIKGAEYTSARSLFDPLIADSKKNLKTTNRSLPNETRKEALVRGILCRGLQDVTDLVETTSSSDWLENPTLVEKAWNHLWDARDRLTYTLRHFNLDRVNWVLAQLEKVYKDFLASYGSGFYFSPEIVWKRELCSICKSDFRSCSHLRGEIYDGVRCTGLPDGVGFRNTAIVTVPADPRCRIWPWQLKEEDGQWRLENVCILTSFRLEDFVDED